MLTPTENNSNNHVLVPAMIWYEMKFDFTINKKGLLLEMCGIILRSGLAPKSLSNLREWWLKRLKKKFLGFVSLGSRLQKLAI